MIVAVTGASGFVGGAVCRAAGAAGHEVRAFGRRPHVDPVHVGGAPYTAADLDDGPPPLADAEAVVHCAGAPSDTLPTRRLWDTHVGGTRAVLAAVGRGVRVVHVSSASVYDPRRPAVRAREHEAPVAVYPDGYGASKAAAERLVRGARPDAVILRPHAVYGPGETTLLPRLRAGVRGGRLPVPGRGARLVSLTRVDNLVAAVLAALTEGAGGTFNVADAEPVDLHDVLVAVLAARGVAVRPLDLPVGVAHPVAAVAEWAARGRRREPVLSRYAVRHVAVERTLDLSAAYARLGYRPAPTDVSDAAAW